MAHDFAYDLKEADVERFQALVNEVLAMLAATTRNRGTARAWFVSEAVILRDRLSEELRRIEAADPGDPLWVGVSVPRARKDAGAAPA